jgi:hypothetical protein
MGNDGHYDAIICLLSVSVKDNEKNMTLFKRNSDFIIYVTKIIK